MALVPALLLAALCLMVGGLVVYLAYRYQNAKQKADAAKAASDKKISDLERRVEKLQAKRGAEERHLSHQRAQEDIVRLQIMVASDALDVLGRMDPASMRDVIQKFAPHLEKEQP